MFLLKFRRALFFLYASLLLTGCGTAWTPGVVPVLPSTSSAGVQTGVKTQVSLAATSSLPASPEGISSASPTLPATNPPTLTAFPATPTITLASHTPDLRPSPLPALTLTATVTPINRLVCDRAAPGVPLDVTVPDDAQMDAGEQFTKIWRLQNTGACTWTTEYMLSFFSGHTMSAPLAVHIPDNVAPGETIDVSIDMISPLAGGLYQGNWKLQNSKSEWFGIGPNGDSAFWVRIQVIAPPTETPTPTATAAETPTPGPDDPVLLVLLPDSRVDLDQRGLALELIQADLLYEVVSSDGVSQHRLVPLENTQLGWFGAQSPTSDECQAAALANTPVVLDSLTPGDYLCYLTQDGTQGWARVDSFSNPENTLSVYLFNWLSEP